MINLWTKEFKCE